MMGAALPLVPNYCLLPTAYCSSSRMRDQLPEHEGEDAAVAVVVDLDGRVDAQRQGHPLLRAVGAADAERHVLARRDLAALEARDVDDLGAVQAQSLGVDVVLELER